jgi:hypothetical protein
MIDDDDAFDCGFDPIDGLLNVFGHVISYILFEL